MEKDNIQKELFEFDAPKKQPRKFGQLFQQADFAFSLTAEKIVFVSIGIIMLLVVSFALGVERGKAISVRTVEAKPAPAQAMVQAPAQRVQGQPTAAQVEPAAGQAQQPAQVKTAATNIKPKEKSPAAAAKPAQNLSKPADLANKAKPYTIVAAAFSKEVFATKELSRLKAGGFEPFVYYSEPYYLVCVGSFANKDSAQKVLNKVKQMHRDAYVRLR